MKTIGTLLALSLLAAGAAGCADSYGAGDAGYGYHHNDGAYDRDRDPYYNRDRGGYFDRDGNRYDRRDDGSYSRDGNRYCRNSDGAYDRCN